MAAYLYVVPLAWAVRNERRWAKSPKTGTEALLEPYFYLGTERQWSKSHILAFYTVKHLQPSAMCLNVSLLWAFISKGKCWWERGREVQQRREWRERPIEAHSCPGIKESSFKQIKIMLQALIRIISQALIRIQWEQAFYSICEPQPHPAQKYPF